MKGDDNFRTESKSYTQFANEVYAFTKIIPFYQEFCEKHTNDAAGASVPQSWVPFSYYGYFGKVPGRIVNFINALLLSKTKLYFTKHCLSF